MFVKCHYLLLRELVHPDKERSLDSLGVSVAGIVVGIVTLEINVDGEDDGVAGDELLNFEAGGKVGGFVDGSHGSSFVRVQTLAQFTVTLVTVSDKVL